MKIRIVVSILMFAAFAAANAERDLTYPPTGASAPIVDQTTGQENNTSPLTAEEAEYRRNLSNRQHTIITPNFAAETIEKQRNAPIVKPSPKQNNFNDRTLQKSRGAKNAIPAQVSNSISQGLLWKIERTSMKTSYLFGTMHVDDPRVTTLPESIRLAFKQSDIFTPEITMEMSDLASMSLEMFNTGGYSLESVIGLSLFSQVATILEPRGIPPLLAKNMKPWAVALVLSMPATRNGDVLDRKLYLQAKQQGKRIQALETLGEQISIFNNMSEQDQIALLKGAVANYEKMPAMIEQLIQAYLSRNLGQLQSLSRAFAPDDPDMAEMLNQILVVKRNVNMADRLTPILKQGNAFIAVGALHLPGKSGVIRLLQNRGFKLTAVY